MNGEKLSAPSRELNRGNRRSIRLPDFDYSRAGAYYVTICAKDRECLFGDVVDGRALLNEVGEVDSSSWVWLSEQYGYIELDEFVVMPNHLHGVIVIEDCRGGSRTAPSRTAPTKRKPLGRLVGAFKTVSTKQINIMRHVDGIPVWQRNYYEHVIRNEADRDRIREYIAHNPAKWETDLENPRVARAVRDDVGAVREPPLPNGRRNMFARNDP